MDRHEIVERSTLQGFHLKLYGGGVVTLWRTPDGRTLCPVCGFPLPGEPPYHYGVDDDDAFELAAQDESERASPSFEICSSCKTQFGFDDGGTEWTHEKVWDLLRLDWLDEHGWQEKQLDQLEF